MTKNSANADSPGRQQRIAAAEYGNIRTVLQQSSRRYGTHILHRLLETICKLLGFAPIAHDKRATAMGPNAVAQSVAIRVDRTEA